MIKAGIMGATGYAGAEVLRICANHPEFEVAVITSDSEAGQADRRHISRVSRRLRQPGARTARNRFAAFVRRRLHGRTPQSWHAPCASSRQGGRDVHRPFRRFPFRATQPTMKPPTTCSTPRPSCSSAQRSGNPKLTVPPLMSLRRAMPQARPLSLAALAAM